MLSIQVLSVLTTYEIYNGNKTFKQEECCACMTNKTNVLFCNCGHICICERCLPLNRENECPVCKKFSNIIRMLYKNFIYEKKFFFFFFFFLFL